MVARIDPHIGQHLPGAVPVSLVHRELRRVLSSTDMQATYHREFRTVLVVGVVILVPVLFLAGMFGQPAFFIPALTTLLEFLLISVPLGRIGPSHPPSPQTPCLAELFDRPPPASL